MPSLFNKVLSFAKSPQGKKLLDQAEKAASNKKVQQEAESIASQAEKKI